MTLVAHPDDELLWFGGLLPTYAGERKLAVQVVYVVPTTPNRRLELLDGLQHCGVTAYPAFVGMRDTRSNTLAGQYKRWNKNRLFETMTGFVRRYKPDVLVTQDFNGEYGHGAHRATADAAVKAVETVDTCVGRVVEAMREIGGISLITADHGNAERMLDEDGKSPFTAHTTNPVPFVIVGAQVCLRDGRLADIAPTMLDLMGINPPEEMDGKSLIIG